MLELFLKLLFAHFVGDFIFQPYKWVASKETYKHKSPYLYWHIAVHAFATLVVLGFDSSYWVGFVAIVLSHLAIDVWKLHQKNNSKSILPFFLDQLAHISVLVAVVYYYMPFQINWSSILTPQVLLFLLFFVFITNVSAIVMKVFIAQLGIPNINELVAKDRAGTLVGILERLLVFIFIVLNFWIGIGFLFVAKSVLRFAHVNRTKDQGVTDYYFVGTLLSFGLAIIAGVTYTYCTTVLMPTSLNFAGLLTFSI